LAATVLLLVGCVTSLNPLYTDKELVYDPALIGVWADDGTDAHTWTFEKGGERSYKLVVAHGDKSSPFVAHLVELGEHRFLDLCPDQPSLDDLKRDELYKVALIPGHLFVKVIQIKPTLRVAVMDSEWLDKLLEKKTKALAHQKMEDGRIVLTASTKALQGFMSKHWGTEGAWGDKTTEMKRK